MEDLKKLNVKNWKETAKDRRTWRDLDEKAKTHKGLECQMMMMMLMYSKYGAELQPSKKGAAVHPEELEDHYLKNFVPL